MLERILHLSIRHRWLVLLLTFAVAAVGFYSLRQLPIDAVPDITNNQVTINTLVLSLSPAEIEKQVTFPIETALAGIPGLQFTRSFSRNGFSQVTAVFRDDVSVDYARIQIDQRLRVARDSLPAGAQPTMGPVSTGLSDIYMWAVDYDEKHAITEPGKPGWQADGSYLTDRNERLTTDIQRAAYLRTVEDWIIRPQLKNVEGVADVDTLGGYEKQYTVEPDPMKLVSYGLGLGDVSSALERNNSSRGAGAIEHKGESYPVRISGLLETPDQIGLVKLSGRNGTPVRIKDVADVSIGTEIRTGAASLNGHEVVIGTVLMLIGANSRTVSEAVDVKMVDVNRTLPPGIHATTIYNRKKLVDSTIHTVGSNLGEGAILVVVILLVLLGNIRAAIITALAIPLSMLITAFGMVQSKVSGNLMSLGAIDFGIIVDGSVIIVENCLRVLAERQRELGRILTREERLETVFTASKQVRSATAFGEAIIIIVYLPILALTGVEGKMFHPMALTVIFALIAAFILSLTFIPAMVALCIGGKVQEKENIIVHAAKKAYEPLLRWAVRGRWVVVPLAILAFGASLLLFLQLGQEFIPTLDEQDVNILTTRIPSSSLVTSLQTQSEIETKLKLMPEVELVFSKIGTAEMASDPMPISSADTLVMLKPRPQWPNPHLSKADLVKRMEEIMATVPGVNSEFSQPIQDRFNDLLAGTKGDIAVKVFGEDFDSMRKPVASIVKILQSIKGAQDVHAEQTRGLPLMNVKPDSAALSRHGLDVSDVQDIVATAIGGKEAGVILEGDRKFALVVRLPEAIRQDLNMLRNLPIPLRNAQKDAGDPAVAAPVVATAFDVAKGPGFIPLSSVASLNVEEGLNEINRENGKRRITVQCNVRDRDIGSFVTEAQQKIKADVTLPAGYWISWGGQFENLLAARYRLMLVVPVCFFLIFLMLFGTFHSVKYALVVFSGVPLALTGGIVALYLRQIPFSISAAVGFIALSGVAVLNGLVMVTFINQLRAEGMELEEAVLRGSLTRLRPVLMTALVASLGFLPMALATGAGAEVQKPLATVVIGGIISSTILTLLVLPALYRLFSRKEKREAVVADEPLVAVAAH
jgi:cobalt-zinc-cadmium resistance protein CzcA